MGMPALSETPPAESVKEMEALCALGRFEPRMEDGRMVVEMTDAQGGDCSVCVSLRAEVGA